MKLTKSCCFLLSSVAMLLPVNGYSSNNERLPDFFDLFMRNGGANRSESQEESRELNGSTRSAQEEPHQAQPLEAASRALESMAQALNNQVALNQQLQNELLARLHSSHQNESENFLSFFLLTSYLTQVQENRTLTTENQRLRGQVSHLEGSLEQLEEDYQDTRRDLNQLNQDYRDLQNDYVQLRNGMRQRDSILRSTVEQAEGLQAAHDVTLQELQRLTEENERLKSGVQGDLAFEEGEVPENRICSLMQESDAAVWGSNGEVDSDSGNPLLPLSRGGSASLGSDELEESDPSERAEEGATSLREEESFPPMFSQVNRGDFSYETPMSYTLASDLSVAPGGGGDRPDLYFLLHQNETLRSTEEIEGIEGILGNLRATVLGYNAFTLSSETEHSLAENWLLSPAVEEAASESRLRRPFFSEESIYFPPIPPFNLSEFVVPRFTHFDLSTSIFSHASDEEEPEANTFERSGMQIDEIAWGGRWGNYNLILGNEEEEPAELGFASLFASDEEEDSSERDQD